MAAYSCKVNVIIKNLKMMLQFFKFWNLLLNYFSDLKMSLLRTFSGLVHPTQVPRTPYSLAVSLARTVSRTDSLARLNHNKVTSGLNQWDEKQVLPGTQAKFSWPAFNER